MQITYDVYIYVGAHVCVLTEQTTHRRLFHIQDIDAWNYMMIPFHKLFLYCTAIFFLFFKCGSGRAGTQRIELEAEVTLGSLCKLSLV